jgi:hypothetical protein
MRGLSKAETLRLIEIEQFVETGERMDGLQVTDEWVEDSIKFLASKMRPTLEAWASIGDTQTREALIVIEAKKLWRLWNRGVRGEKLEAAFEALGHYIQKADAEEKAEKTS